MSLLRNPPWKACVALGLGLSALGCVDTVTVDVRRPSAYFDPPPPVPDPRSPPVSIRPVACRPAPEGPRRRRVCGEVAWTNACSASGTSGFVDDVEEVSRPSVPAAVAAIVVGAVATAGGTLLSAATATPASRGSPSAIGASVTGAAVGAIGVGTTAGGIALVSREPRVRSVATEVAPAPAQNDASTGVSCAPIGYVALGLTLKLPHQLVPIAVDERGRFEVSFDDDGDLPWSAEILATGGQRVGSLELEDAAPPRALDALVGRAEGPP